MFTLEQFTEEQKYVYEGFIGACTEVINNKKQDSIFKDAELSLIKGFAFLMVLNENLVNEIIANCKDPDKVMEIWDSVPDDHPTRLYFNQIQSLSPRIRSSVIIGAMLTVNQLKDEINELKEKA